MAFPALGHFDYVAVWSNSKWGAPFHRIAYNYSCADWDGLCDHLRDFPCGDIFKLSISAASEFSEWVQVGINVYIPHCKYHVKHHHMVFSCLCCCHSSYKSLFLFVSTESYESKGKFKQASSRCKKVLEAAKLAYATKTNESITSQKLGC